MKQIIKRYLTLNPRLLAALDLKSLMERLTLEGKDDFIKEYEAWKNEWKDTLNKRTELKNGKSHYRHRRLRSAMNSIDFYLPYLFTYQEDGCSGMPNTNNKIEGTFTDLKRNLNDHSGMSETNRKRFVCGFFLGIDINSKHEKAGAYNADSCSCLSFYTILFLMELLPSRAPLCFRLRDKVTKQN